MTLWWRRPEAAPKTTAARHVLGISLSAEGSAAAMLRDDAVIFSAIEHGAAFPSEAVRSALEAASEAEGQVLGMRDLDAVAFCGKPGKTFALARTEWLLSAPRGFGQFRRTAPAAFTAGALGPAALGNRLAALSWGEKPRLLLYPDHQLCCAASAFFASGFRDSAVLVLDGPIDGPAASISLGSGEQVKMLRELSYPDSPQALSAALAAYAGFAPESAWELFTLQGEADTARTSEMYERITGELVTIKDDGSLRLNPGYFLRADGLRADTRAWNGLFGAGPWKDGDESGERLAFAAAARGALEEILFRMGSQAKRFAFSNNLCICGGAELKLAAEGKLKAAGLFSNIWSQPYSAPEARAAGAALAARHIYQAVKRPVYAAGSWDPPKPEIPEERPMPQQLGENYGASLIAGLRYALYFWLLLVPAAAWSRLKPKPSAGRRARDGQPASFYSVKGRIYSAADLESPV